MSDFKKQMSGLTHGENATGGLYALLIGMSLGNLLPSPSDALYFMLQTKLRDRWKRGELTATKYWRLNTAYYYFVPFTYWAVLALVVVNIKGDYHKKLKLAGALVGAGVALGVVLKLIQNDKQQLIKEEEEKLLLLQKHPEVVNILKQPEYENISAQLVNGNGTYTKLSREREEENNK